MLIVREGSIFSQKFINETNESLFFVLCVAIICLLCNSFSADYTESVNYYCSRVNSIRRYKEKSGYTGSTLSYGRHWRTSKPIQRQTTYILLCCTFIPNSMNSNSIMKVRTCVCAHTHLIPPVQVQIQFILL